MVPPALPRPLVPRHLGRPGRPHVAGVWQRPPDAPGARPTREDAEPRRDLEPGRPPPGLRGSELPVPRAVLSARIGSPRTTEPLDHHDGAHGLAEGRPITGEFMPRAGLEPATSRSSVSHSPKLSYRGARTW